MNPETQERRAREKQMERYDRHMNKYGHFSCRRKKSREKDSQNEEEERELEQEEGK